MRGKRLVASVVAGMMAMSVSQTALATGLQRDLTAQSENDLKLWYTKSASIAGKGLNANQVWEEYTLPIGNGNLGGNVYGDVASEHISFNEKTLWSGGPSSKRPNYNGGNKTHGSDGRPMSEILKEIQDLFALHTEEGNRRASQLCNELVGISDGYGAYQAWGDVYIDFKDITNEQVENYYRDLDLTDSTAGVSFTKGDTTYNREFFASNPDNVLVIYLSAEGSEDLDFDVRFPSKHGATPVAEGNTITVEGEVSDNQLKFNSSLKVVVPEGEVITNGDKLTIKDAEEAYIYISAATDYKNDYPVYRTGETAENLHDRVEATVDAAIEKGFDKVREDHISDYKNIFDRVSLDIGQEASSVPTDELLTEYNKKNNSTISDAEKLSLEGLLFQFGRYLTISSSREDSQLPSNLQGLWNNRNDPPWSSDYHMNVNLQMNYWPTYSTNMAETGIPLVNYINSLREPGRETARIYAGVESAKDPVTGEYTEANGFMAHTQNTPFGWTTPGWSFDWGWSPAAVPWILQNCWEMFEYTGDVEYMKTELYPMMKEEVNLYENMLIWDEVQQRMVSSPTYSPEHGPRTVGNTYEQTLIWQLYDDTIKAAEILGEDPALIAEWKDTQSKLDPVQIGDDGQIKEWYEETTLGSIPSEGYGHRHLSHLLGVFPGDLISVETPELLEAAKVSLRNRTDQSTGWGMGQRINTWARVGEGNKAHELITNQLKKVGTGIAGGGGTFSNLWCAHPPFQIDGNFGATSGIAEMLMQSNVGYINFLPALPDAWPEGEVQGLLARGNFEVGAKWSNGSADELTVTSKDGGECVVKYENLSFANVKDSKGKNVDYKVIDGDKISFETKVGETYIINQIPKKEVKEEAPTGLAAERLESTYVDLAWNEVAGKDVTYNVYRQINKGDLIKVAKNIEANEFRDLDAKDILGTFNYMVSAVVDGKETKLSTPVQVKDLRNMAGFIDDQDPRVTYVGGWGNWSEAVNHAGTIKFLENPTGTETATLTFVGTGIEVLTCKAADRGKLEISIDGKVIEEVDTYSPSVVRKSTIFSKTDLEYGKHTITVRATNTKSPSASKTKVELDAFKVLDTTVAKPQSVNVGTKSGITTVAVPNTTLEMKAEVLPTNATNKEVTWSVSDTNIATIDQNGVLTTKASNGIVRVTATAKDNAAAVGYVDIKVAIPTNNIEEKIVEDGFLNGTKNPEITWGGSWSTWAGEADRHHGGTKTEATTGATITYDFIGTGIEVYAQKHANFSSFDIEIDGVSKGNFSLAGSGSGDDQQLVAEFKDLENTNHTIKMIAVDRDGKRQVNLDYFKVIKPIEGELVDKTQLQALILEEAKKAEANYTRETWVNFKAAYDEAVKVMNNDEATSEEIMSVISNLMSASEALVSQEAEGPFIPSGANVDAIGIESKTAVLTWPLIEGAVKYEVYNVTTGDAVKVGETTTNNFRLLDLTENTVYRFLVKAVNEAGKSSEFGVCGVQTLEGDDTEAPSNVEGLNVSVLNQTTAKVTWNEATDNKGVSGYKVYLNGELQGETKTPEFTLNELTVGNEYTVKVVAIDEAGNTSAIPAGAKFTIESEEAEIIVSKIQNLKASATTNNVSLIWDAPASTVGLVEYIVYKDGKVYGTVKAGNTSIEIPELKSNTIYGFKVIAKFSNNEESKPVSINVRTQK
ncbi:glycosyl hydrolase family 95 catalytic domain-containing protein [Clostridium sp.]|uniref:glycosyl hydrolase family 95 catalytic domain-containing protein n=1 Tax=Clostridium sp. TaxID=1506 RepID=UPI003F3E4B85